MIIKKENWFKTPSFRKIFKWIPIIGVLPTIYYHFRYGDTGIENIKYNILSAIVQYLGFEILIKFIL